MRYCALTVCTFVALLCAAAVASEASLAPPAPSRGGVGGETRARALVALGATQHLFYDEGGKTFDLHAHDPGSAVLPRRTPVQYWVLAQAWCAVLDAVEAGAAGSAASIPEQLAEGVSALKTHWDRPFYDDLNWMAVALLRSHADVVAGLLPVPTFQPPTLQRLAPGQAPERAAQGTAASTGNSTAYLVTAQWLVDHIMGAWDETCCGTHKGGVWWDASHTQKATASNAGPVISALGLAHAAGDPTGSLTAFAVRVWSFWLGHMVDPRTGQVADHVAASTGQVVWWRFTYNEGLLLGAAAALHAHTGNASFLDDAAPTAEFMVANETIAWGAHGSARDASVHRWHARGPALSRAGVTPRVLYDSGSCGSDCENFKGIGARYAADFVCAVRAAAAAAAAAAANPGRDGRQALARGRARAPSPRTVAAAEALAAVIDDSSAAIWSVARLNATQGWPVFGVEWSQPTRSLANADLRTQVSATAALFASARLAEPECALDPPRLCCAGAGATVSR